MTKMTGIGVFLLLPVLVVGCSSSAEDRPSHVRAACERYVKIRLKTKSATFSGEQMEIGSVRTRATVKGLVDFAIASPAPGEPTRMRQSFMCSVEEHDGDWHLVVLTGLDA